MQVELSGTPGTEVTITDASQIAANQITGVIAVNVIAKRGKLGGTYRITTPTEYRRKLGGKVAGNNDYEVCMRALKKGAPLEVNRIHHLTDQTDASTVDGSPAIGTLTEAAVAEILAKATAVVTGAGAQNDQILIRVETAPSTYVTLGTTTVPATPTPTSVATAMRATINANTGSHNYTASGTDANVIVSAPTGTGDTPNTYNLVLTVTGTATFTATTIAFADGADAIPQYDADFESESVGDGYNGTVVTIVKSISNIADRVDIKVQLPDSDQPIEVMNFARTLDADLADTLNGTLEGVKLDYSSLTGGVLPIGTVTLTGGVQDISNIDDLDYIGDTVTSTGFNAFNETTDVFRIFNFSRPTAAANQGLTDYLEQRKDMRGRIYMPYGLSIAGMNAFRDGTSPYNHQPIDSYYVALWEADVFINDPANLTFTKFPISAAGDQIAARSLADRVAPWTSDSDVDNYAKLSGINDVRINLLSAGNKGQYDVLYEKGVNAVGNHKTFKIKNHGNRTCYRDKTSILSKENIADLVITVGNGVSAIAERMNFKANDLIMFKQLYLNVLPYIKDYLVAKRGIQGDETAKRGEDVWWFWQGDQFAKSPNDLKFNTKADYDAGKYRVRFICKPIAANEYIAIDIAPTDSTTIQNVSIIQSL